MTGSSTEENGRIAITLSPLIVVETAVTARSLLAPDLKNAFRQMDFSADLCMTMLMSMI